MELRVSRKWQIFIIWGFAAILPCFASEKQKSVSDPNAHASRAQGVDVFDANGESIGHLNESKDGTSLLLTRIGKETVPLFSYEDNVKRTMSAPGNNITAVLYVRNCGATTDWATRVDLVSANKKAGVDGYNVVFILQGDQPVRIEWKDANTLVINHPAVNSDYIFKQQTQTGRFKIEYHQTTETAARSQYIELSNVNYGAAAMAAGFTEETLLRAAGWAQAKSGLTRKEWGNWYGSSPYGDDPNEQHYIKQGIEIFNLNRDKLQNAKP
jgi:hypothetical protein